MSRKKTITAAGAHLRMALAVAMLAGCASGPPSSTPEDPSSSTATLSGPPADEVPIVGCNAASLRQSLLQRVNQARASGTVCGDARQVATKPLVWQPALAAVATRRATEMAQRGTFGATDPRGTEQRLRQEGYRAAVAQEGAAGGDYTSDTVAQTWLSHQQQCLVLTSAQYTDVGAGCANAPGSELGHYWTVVVARPGEGAASRAAPKAKGKSAAPKPKAVQRGVKPVASNKAVSSTTRKATPSAKKASTAKASKCTAPDCKATPAVR
ncbi:CAP domain-containing protein [Ramlibacter sp. MMS24-I3-19]|uniref:CAP domain-containing protein n=1 Tax=Ramlibacter sp. MMS24-I3-19 TaxID=3416606 RepID=UPI003CFF89A0